MAPATAMSQPPAVRPVPPSTPPLESLCVRERARVALRECHALVTQFFHAIDGLLSGRANTGSTLRAEELMEKVLERQVELRKLIDEVIEHQRLNKMIERLMDEDRTEEKKLATLNAALRDGETALQTKLDELKPRINAMELANKRPVDVDEVVSYGTKIGASIAAPAGWDPSQPLGRHLPPAPTDDMMRVGRLAAMSTNPEGGAQDKMEADRGYASHIVS